MAFRRRPGGLPYNRRTPVIAADQPASNAAGSEYVFGIHSSALYNSQHTGFIVKASAGFQGPSVSQFTAGPQNQDLTLQAQIFKALQPFSNAPGSEYIFGTHALAIYAQSQGTVFPAAATPTVVVSFAVKFVSAGPQGADLSLQAQIEQSAPGYQGPSIKPLQAAPQNVDLTLAAQIRPSVPGLQGSTVRAFTVVPQTPEVLAALSVPAALGSTSATAALTGALATFTAGNVSLNQPAGRHHKRYAVRHGWRLFIYDSKAHADAARRKHKKKKVLPKPLEVIELETVKEVAKARGVLRQVESLLETQQYIEVVSLHKRLMQMREEEEIALTMLFDYSPSEKPYDEEELAVALLLAA